MKKVLGTITTCILAGSFISAYADNASGVATTVKKQTQFKDAVMKDQKPDDGLGWMDGLSGNLTLVSNYVFRGITQSSNLPAMQGGFTYTFPIGIYLNVWGSNVKFNDDNYAVVELDTIIGYHQSFFNDDFTVDVNAARYNYPGARLLNYNELNSLFNYKFLQAGISYSANVYNVHETGTYYQGGINYDIPANYFFNINGMNITALLGHYSLPVAAGNRYSDYFISVSKALRNYTLALQWKNTNGGQHNSPYDSSAIIGMVSADF